MATRKTAKQAEQMRISQIGDFKNRVGGILELPSGLVIRWRNPGGLRAFMSSGKIPNVLMNVIQGHLKQNSKESEAEMEAKVIQELQDNPELLTQMNDLFDSVARRCFVEPKLYPAPDQAMLDEWNRLNPDDKYDDPEDLRYEDRLYVDEVPQEDKEYLFNLINGGVKDLEQFREERSINVASLAKVSGVVGVSVDDVGADTGKS